MRIAVVGCGGVGGYFGGRLAASGCDVTFVARGAHLQAMRQDGLRIVSPLGDLVLRNAKMVDEPAKAGPVDLVIVAVKLWDTDRVAAAVKPLVDQGASVVSFQNGVDKDAVLQKHLPAASIFGGVSYISAVISAPGIITHSGATPRLVFGEYDGSHSPRVQGLLDACRAAGIEARITDAIELLTWEKFVFLVGLSATTAAMRKPIGPIREHPRSRAFLLEVMREVVAVGRAKGVPLRPDYAEDRLRFCDTLPPTMTSSMWHDLERGHRLELPWLSGAVAKLAETLKLPAPHNQAIADILALWAAGAEGMSG